MERHDAQPEAGLSFTFASFGDPVQQHPQANAQNFSARFPIMAERRRCRPLMAFGPTINLGNGRERHFTALRLNGFSIRVPAKSAASLKRSVANMNGDQGKACRNDSGILALRYRGLCLWNGSRGCSPTRADSSKRGPTQLG